MSLLVLFGGHTCFNSWHVAMPARAITTVTSELNMTDHIALAWFWVFLPDRSTSHLLWVWEGRLALFSTCHISGEFQVSDVFVYLCCFFFILTYAVVEPIVDELGREALSLPFIPGFFFYFHKHISERALLKMFHIMWGTLEKEYVLAHNFRC